MTTETTPNTTGWCRNGPCCTLSFSFLLVLQVVLLLVLVLVLFWVFDPPFLSVCPSHLLQGQRATKKDS